MKLILSLFLFCSVAYAKNLPTSQSCEIKVQAQHVIISSKIVLKNSWKGVDKEETVTIIKNSPVRELVKDIKEISQTGQFRNLVILRDEYLTYSVQGISLKDLRNKISNCN